MQAPTLASGDTRRAAAYTRVSTDDQAEEGHSLGEQARRARELIDRERWEYVGTFEDAAVSGARASRPALDRLLDATAANQVDVIVVSALDRLSRDSSHLRDMLRVFDAAGVAVVASGQQLDRTTPEGHLQTGILAEFAEFERRKIKQRTSAGIHGRAVAEGKPWSAPAYGYRKQSGGDHWEHAPAEVPIVRRIFRERVEDGRSYSSIAKGLNRDGIAPRRGANWSPRLIPKILAGWYVRGYFKHHEEWIKGRHEPIIDERTWEAAQTLAAMGARYAPSRGGRKPHAHLFTNGLLRCSVCSEAMLPRSDGDLYACRSNIQLRGAGTCTMPRHKREDVDAAGLEFFERSFLDLDATRDRIASDLGARLDEIDAELQRATREATEKAAQLAKVERDYFAGDLTAATYERLTAKLGGEHTAADAERDRIASHADSIRGSRLELDAEGDALRRLADLRIAVLDRKRTAEQATDVETLRAALHQCFSAAYLGADGSIGSCILRLSEADEELLASEEPVPPMDPSALTRPLALAPRTTQHLTLVS